MPQFIKHQHAVPAPGSYCRIRTFTLNAATFTVVDLRSEDWAGHASTGQPAGWNTLSRLTRINARIVGAEDGDVLQLAKATPSTPDEAWLSADHQVALQFDFLPSDNASSWQWKTSGSLTVQVEVYFDILNEREV